MIIAWLDSLGIRGLTFRLSYQEKVRLVWVSLLPAIVLVAFAVELALRFGWDMPYSGLYSGAFRHEGQLKAFFVSSSLKQYSGYLGLAVLIFISIAHVTRGMASWAVVGSVVFMTLTLICIVVGTAPYVFVSPNEYNTLFNDIRIDAFQEALVPFGLLAAGYAFMAYSGLPPEVPETGEFTAESGS